MADPITPKRFTIRLLEDNFVKLWHINDKVYYTYSGLRYINRDYFAIYKTDENVYIEHWIRELYEKRPTLYDQLISAAKYVCVPTDEMLDSTTPGGYKAVSLETIEKYKDQLQKIVLED
jgi:hypothetical protein